jgi:signal transduction histidine kinase
MRIFERFVRGGRDGARGSGLGLSIVHSVAESHGGSVVLETTAENRGARFVVRLPAAGLDGELGEEAQTSTTTGSTIGRRRSRS